MREGVMKKTEPNEDPESEGQKGKLQSRVIREGRYNEGSQMRKRREGRQKKVPRREIGTKGRPDGDFGPKESIRKNHADRDQEGGEKKYTKWPLVEEQTGEKVLEKPLMRDRQ